MKMPPFRLRGFKRPREIASDGLGKLEQAVMDEAWRRGELSVRDVHEAFAGDVAYTTLMTTLDRLYKKDLLSRRKLGRAYLYNPCVSRDGFQQGITEDVIDGLFSGANGVQPILACIVDAIGECDRESLDELDRLVKEKKLELKHRV